jgi:hypothetical protein
LLPPVKATTFKNPPLIPTATDVVDFVTADINNDGKPDIVYVDGQAYGQRAVHVLLNNGNGTFTHATDIALPAGICCDLTVADVTGDGKLDLVLAGNSSTAVLIGEFTGNGDGTFQTPAVSSFVPNGFNGFPRFVGLRAGDLNGDGKLDLALFTGSDLYILLGNSSGSFTYSADLTAYQNGANADSVSLVDLNGDGHLDIVTTDDLGADFEVFLGNGNGTFANFVRYSVNNAAGPFLLADVDGDGHPDVVTIYYPSGDITQGVFYQIGVFKGNADGTFSALSDIGNSPSQGNPLVAAVDLNGDGIPDLIFLTPSGLAVSLGSTGRTFGSTLTTISGGSMSPYSTLPTKPLTADFNRDGYVDIAMAVEGGIELLFGSGNGTFASDQFYDMGRAVGSAAVAKFSGSGNMDIAVTLPAAVPRLLLGDGKGGFTLGADPNLSYGSQTPFMTILPADFNGDGKPDVNVGNMAPNQASVGSTQSAEFNQGNGVFSAPISVANSSPIMADFNRDGLSDIVNVSGQQITVSLGQANKSFTTVTTALRNPFGTGFFNTGDVNNDGKPDLILNYNGQLEVWLGNGNGTFTYSTSMGLPNGISDAVAAIADIDGDGSADIVLGPTYNSSTPIAILYGNGNGTFLAPVFLPTSRAYQYVVVTDVDRDNLPDLVMTDGATIAVILNLGNRNFDAEVDYIAGRSIAGLNVVDVNGDGYPDIIVANGDGYPGVSGPNFSGSTVTVLLNEPNGTPAAGASVKGSISVKPEPSIAGQPFTVTLSVASQTTGGPVPTGSVGFSLDGVFIADAPVVNGSASYTDSSSLIPVQHTVTAAYNGDSNYAPRSFSATHLVQPPTYVTSTTINAAPATVLASQTVRLTASITSTTAVPGGVVTFLDAGNTIGSAPLVSGVASFDTGLLAPGAHSLSAMFDGYIQYGFNGNTAYVAATFSRSTSSGTAVLVNTDATAVSLAASSTSATAGTVLAFAAHVTSNAGTPFGGVSFYDGSELLGTLALSGQGQVSFSTASLSAGTHSISAAFNANGPYGGSVSTVQTVSITSASASQGASRVTLALQTDTFGGTSRLVATVSGEGADSSRVTFLDTGVILGSAPVSSLGVAEIPFQQGAGLHVLTASFAGTSRVAPSVSPALNEQWPSSGPGFSLRIATQANPSNPSVVASFLVSVLPDRDFRQPLMLSCSSALPNGYACEFAPAFLAASGNSMLLVLTGSERASMRRIPAPWSGTLLAFGCILLLATAKNRHSRITVVFFGCFLVIFFTGCRNSARSSHATQAVVLTVQASTAIEAQAIIHSVQVAVRLPAGK